MQVVSLFHLGFEFAEFTSNYDNCSSPHAFSMCVYVCIYIYIYIIYIYIYIYIYIIYDILYKYYHI